jgi:hypothetical protein
MKMEKVVCVQRLQLLRRFMKSGKSRLEAAENMRDMKKRTVTGKIDQLVETALDTTEQILCQERTDAFVVAVLYFAMVTGEDIEYEGVLSNELYHNLNTNLIPMHCNERSGLKPIRIIGRTESRKIESLDKNV